LLHPTHTAPRFFCTSLRYILSKKNALQHVRLSKALVYKIENEHPQMNKIILFFSLIVSSCVISAAEDKESKFDMSTAVPIDFEVVEKWECRDSGGYWADILVRALVGKNRETGYVQVAGVSQASRFQVKGFSRRWDFGLSEENSYKYAFVIEPNGGASYYDFSLKKQSKPSIAMKCRQVKN
jgi:hypothetical protein